MFKTIGSNIGPGQRSLKWSLRHPLTRVRMNNGQNISNGTSFTSRTDVLWDTIILDEVSAFNGGSSLVTPEKFNLVRFQIRWIWALNSTGNRWHQLMQGSTPVSELLAMASIAALNADANSATTAWLQTNPGDAWKLSVGQSSGGTLTFSPSAGSFGQAFMQAEWGIK